MKLSQLLTIYSELHWGSSAEKEVRGITQDSRAVEPGFIFVAVKGLRSDGHHYLQEAVERGALALVVERDVAAAPQSCLAKYSGAKVRVANSRVALNELTSAFYGWPTRQAYCIGVTGTNGKTSIVYMIERILSEFGWKTGVLGTIDHHLGKQKWKTNLTTADAVSLQRRLAEMVSLGAKALTFEVSSHALDQNRIDAVPFDVAVFSNLTRDHLDYHHDMEHYFKAKQRLFLELIREEGGRRPVAIVNIDDSYGKRLEVSPRCRHWTYGRQQGDFQFKVKQQSFLGMELDFETPRGHQSATFPLVGLHNAYNLTAAIAAGLACGVSLDLCLQALSQFQGAPGRLERVDNQRGLNVFVDYAHTPDALRSVLVGLNLIRSQAGGANQIITVFGCGGNRDKGKRPLMAQEAMVASDLVVLTSDNPRDEDPLEIIEDALAVVPLQERDRSFFTEVDRRAAIQRAINMARSGDVILIAGKGHEDYQLIGDRRLDFSDVAVARELLL